MNHSPQKECCDGCGFLKTHLGTNTFREPVCVKNDCTCHLPDKNIGWALQKTHAEVGGALRALGGDVKESWEERFKKEYIHGRLYIEPVGRGVPLKELKSFIHQVEKEAEQRGRDMAVEAFNELLDEQDELNNGIRLPNEMYAMAVRHVRERLPIFLEVRTITNKEK